MTNPVNPPHPENILPLLEETLSLRKQAKDQVKAVETMLTRFAAFLFEDHESNPSGTFNEAVFKEFLKTCRRDSKDRASLRDPKNKKVVLKEIMAMTGLCEKNASQVYSRLQRKFELDDVFDVIRQNSHQVSQKIFTRGCLGDETYAHKVKTCLKNMHETMPQIPPIALPLLRISNPNFFKNIQRAVTKDSFLHTPKTPSRER